MYLVRAQTMTAHCFSTKQKSPALPGSLMNIFFVQFTWSFSSLRELGDLMRKSRDLSARIVLVNDLALCRAHQLRLGVSHCLQRRITIAALDRFFDVTDGATHLRAARLIDDGAASNLARRFLGRGRIRHALKFLSR